MPFFKFIYEQVDPVHETIYRSPNYSSNYDSQARIRLKPDVVYDKLYHDKHKETILDDYEKVEVFE